MPPAVELQSPNHWIPGWEVSDPFAVYIPWYMLCVTLCVLGSEVSVVIMGVCPKT